MTLQIFDQNISFIYISWKFWIVYFYFQSIILYLDNPEDFIFEDVEEPEPKPELYINPTDDEDEDENENEAMDVDNVEVLEEESEEESDWEDEEEDEEEKEEKKKKEEEENDSEEESSEEEDDDDDIHTVDHIIKKRVVKGKKCSSGSPQESRYVDSIYLDSLFASSKISA